MGICGGRGPLAGSPYRALPRNTAGGSQAPPRYVSYAARSARAGADQRLGGADRSSVVGVEERSAVGGEAADVASVPNAAELRRRGLEAARRRELTAQGLSQQRVREIRERQRKEELLARVFEKYRNCRQDAPLGLRAATVEQLERHLVLKS
eukprot:TRINITY_DN17994_c0_g1_i1.p1 TRINITY_DN17994_c0_g1~~TRINITY_DN17994_c0_g1_i1.p1  ORF type:complete len:152 (-),score=39.46 TRINITY_DN17994_c0_g1_i1:390-845(-)